MKRAWQVLFFALVLATLAQAAWHYDRLPDRVATHFNGAGRANGWMSRGAHTAWHLATVGFVAVLIQGIVWAGDRLPPEYVNLPRRAYWLAPERAAATRAWIAGGVQLLGCALLAFFLALFHLIYRANLTPAPALSGAVWWLTGGLLAFTAGWVVALFLRFGRAPAA